MKKIEAKIVADSISPQRYRITTMLLTFPRFILAELNTHRVFSRNSASSRAIPFEKMVKMVEEDPFIPIAWQKDHKGMQGTEYFTDPEDIKELTESWLSALDLAVRRAKEIDEWGATKQLCNRLLEPFMWHTALVTATEFDNFFKLRCPKYNYKGKTFRSKKDLIAANLGTFPKTLSDVEWFQLSTSNAEIHIQALAESIWDTIKESKPKELKEGEWHIPFGDKIEIAPIDNAKWVSLANSKENFKVKIATARCARLSYRTFDNEIDYVKDIQLHDQLLANKHSSPFEHCARAMSDNEHESFIKGRADFYDDRSIAGFRDNGYGWCNNFRGWIQYRYLVENSK